MRKKSHVIFLTVLLAVLVVALYFQPSINRNTETVSSEPEAAKEIILQDKDRYILIGDTGTGNQNQYAVSNAISTYCSQKQDCIAVFILGDVIYPQGVVGMNDIAFEEKFESPYRNIDLPFYILYGNHDYLGCIQCYLDYNERSNKWKIPGRYYSLLSEKVNFYALDTENMDDDQISWLTRELNNNEGFEIVLGHRPIKSYEATKYRQDWSGRNELQQVICNTADLYISAHAHLLEDLGQIEGCGFIHLISGTGGAYIRGIHEPFGGEFYYTGYGFLSIEVESDIVRYEFVNIDQDVLYQNQIIK